MANKWHFCENFLSELTYFSPISNYAPVDCNSITHTPPFFEGKRHVCETNGAHDKPCMIPLITSIFVEVIKVFKTKVVNIMIACLPQGVVLDHVSLEHMGIGHPTEGMVVCAGILQSGA